MIAGLRLNLRAASICLLGMVASISLCASVPAGSAPVKSAHRRAAVPSALQPYSAAIQLALPHTQRRASNQTCLRPELVTLSNPVAHSSARRTFIFVEDTTPPSNDALKLAQLQIPPKPQAPPPPLSQVRRSPFVSVSNRQRAP